MDTEKEIKNLLIQLGVTEEEVSFLSFDSSIEYLRFHHGKIYGECSILFLGFDENETNELSKKAEKKAPTKKVTKPVEKKPAAKKVAVAKKKPVGATVRITQIGSPIGRHPKQRQILIGLGLNKMNKTSELEDTPSVRGMINKVMHLVKIEDAA